MMRVTRVAKVACNMNTRTDHYGGQSYFDMCFLMRYLLHEYPCSKDLVQKAHVTTDLYLYTHMYTYIYIYPYITLKSSTPSQYIYKIEKLQARAETAAQCLATWDTWNCFRASAYPIKCSYMPISTMIPSITMIFLYSYHCYSYYYGYSYF